MNQKTKIILGVVLFVLCIVVASVAYTLLTSRYQPAIPPTTPPATSDSAAPIAAPDFTVLDVDGNEVKLSDFFGKPVVLNVWASWCGPCKVEMPDFDAVYAEEKDDVVFLMVNMTDGKRETVEKGKEFIAANGYSFPIYFDVNQEVAYGYGITAIPCTLFIDKEGNVSGAYRGVISKEALQNNIDLIR